MRVALKVDVGSPRGAEKGVPLLLGLLKEYSVKASFFFSTGAEEESGLFKRTLGLLGGKDSDAAQKLACAMLAVHEAGHEIGLRAHDGAAWSEYAANADQNWTRHQMAMSAEVFEDVLGYAPQSFAAANCQVNPHMFRQQQRMGFRFASDTRGKYPFLPVYQQVEPSCPQIPVTLPTISEMLAQPDVNEDNVHEHIYAESLTPLPFGHVFLARAEYEGGSYLGILEKLLVMWKSQEGSIRTLGELYRELEPEHLPRHQVGWGQVPGIDRHVAMQSIKVEQ